MQKIAIYIFLAWSQLFLHIDGARKEQKGTSAAPLQETTALRRNGKTVLAQAYMSVENNGRMDTSSQAKVSLWQDPHIPVHSLNAMTTTEPGHRPRAFVVVCILIMLMVTLFAAIFATIHRKVSDEVAPRGTFQGPLGQSYFPVSRTQTLKAEAPGDLRRVDDEIAELTKDLTPPSSPQTSEPEPRDHERSEAVSSDEPNTPAKTESAQGLHPALGDAPLPTPPPRSPPKGNRRKRKTDEAPAAETSGKMEAAAAQSVPASDLRNLDDEFAELTQDLAATPSVPASDLRNLDEEFAELAQDLCPQSLSGPSISLPLCGPESIEFIADSLACRAQDFANVKTLRAVSEGELRSHDDEFADLIKELVPSPNRSANGELRSFQDEFSELACDLHTQEPESQV